MRLRCLLFVPANRPERYAKALAAGGDGIIIDMEDAVSPTDKAKGREALLNYLAEVTADDRHRVAVRINSLATADGLRDMLALLDCKRLPAMLMLPKIGSAQEIAQVKALLGNRCPPLLALIETPAAIDGVAAIATSPGLAGLAFGGADYATATGCTMTWEGLAFARSRIVTAAAAANIAAIDVPCLDLDNTSGPVALKVECHKARELGFSGKLCIHPLQVPTVMVAFTPPADAIAQASEIVTAFEQAGGGVCEAAGKMVDAPVYLAAKRLLALSDEEGNR